MTRKENKVEEMQPEKLAHRVEFEKVLRGKKLVL
jgi:hypothetical protein